MWNDLDVFSSRDAPVPLAKKYKKQIKTNSTLYNLLNDESEKSKHFKKQGEILLDILLDAFKCKVSNGDEIGIALHLCVSCCNTFDRCIVNRVDIKTLLLLCQKCTFLDFMQNLTTLLTRLLRMNPVLTGLDKELITRAQRILVYYGANVTYHHLGYQGCYDMAFTYTQIKLPLLSFKAKQSAFGLLPADIVKEILQFIGLSKTFANSIVDVVMTMTNTEKSTPVSKKRKAIDD